MKISMLVLNPFTHDARVAKEAHTLVAAGHTVTVNALWAPGLAAQEVVDGVQVNRIRIRTRESRRIPGAAWVEIYSKVAGALRAQQPQICHAHDLNALIPLGPTANRLKIPLVYDAHEFETGRQTASRSGTLRRWLLKSFEGPLARRARATITVSDSIADSLTRMYGIRRPAVIHNCPELISIPSAGVMRAALQISDDRPIVLFQGGLMVGRGIEAVLQAVAGIPELTYVLVGDGALRTRLEEQASKLKLGDRLRMTGKVPLRELLSYSCDATIGVCLTENTCLNHYYSLPNKLFEYLMVGVPILASDFPDMRQVVLGSGAGRVSDPASPEAITAALRAMLADRPALAEMGRNARCAAEGQYNWEHESQKLLEIYQNLDKTLA